MQAASVNKGIGVGAAVSGRKAKLALISGFALMVGAAIVLSAWQNGIWPLNQRSEEALARRAQQFWDLKISGDTIGAYGFMAGSYRRRVTPDGFARLGGGLVIHTGAAVKAVHVDEKGGTVDLELRYVLNKDHFVGMETTAQVKERWVFEDGAWHRWPPDVG